MGGSYDKGLFDQSIIGAACRFVRNYPLWMIGISIRFYLFKVYEFQKAPLKLRKIRRTYDPSVPIFLNQCGIKWPY